MSDIAHVALILFLFLSKELLDWWKARRLAKKLDEAASDLAEKVERVAAELAAKALTESRL